MSITLHKNAHQSDNNMHEVKGFPSASNQYSIRKDINGQSSFLRDHRLPNVLLTQNGYDAPTTEVEGDIYVIQSDLMEVRDIVWQSGNIIRFRFDSGYDSSLYAAGNYLQISGVTTFTVHNGVWEITTVNALYLEVTNVGVTEGVHDVATTAAVGYVTHENFDPENLSNSQSIPMNGLVKYYATEDLWYGDELQEGDNFFNEATQTFQYWNGSNIITQGTFKNSTTETTTYQVLSTDERIYVDSSGGAFTVTLEAAPITNRELEIIDSVGSCGTYTVTINGNGSNIIGLSTYLMTQNYESIRLLFNGTQWNLI